MRLYRIKVNCLVSPFKGDTGSCRLLTDQQLEGFFMPHWGNMGLVSCFGQHRELGLSPLETIAPMLDNNMAQ